MKNLSGFILLMALCAAALQGCGYSVRRSPVSSVRIGAIENMTPEARLEDRLSEALVSSLLRNGIRVSPASDHAIEGTLKGLSLEQLSERDELTTTYRVIVDGEFFLTGPGGEKKRLAGGGKYIVTFSSRGDLTSVIAAKEIAVERALEDLAEEISASVLYMR